MKNTQAERPMGVESVDLRLLWILLWILIVGMPDWCHGVCMWHNHIFDQKLKHARAVKTSKIIML